MSNDLTLTYSIGEFHFAWLKTSEDIEIYHMVEGRLENLLGLFTTLGPDDELVLFEQDAFELHCQWFICMAAKVTPEDLQ